jgi:hypothetical protein
MLHIAILVMTAIAVYRLWDEVFWLAIAVALIGFTFGLHGDEQREFAQKGEHSDATATRIALTTLIVGGIFLYSLFFV